MKKVVKPGGTPSDFDAQKLYDKSELFAERMYRPDADETENALWSAFALELLARAALANICPALLADPNKDGNLEFALGLPVKNSKFSAISIGIEKVFNRLNSLLPEFVEEHREFCVTHTGLRNAEVHSGRSPYSDIEHWEGRYYQAVEILLKSMGFTFADYIGDEQAKVAHKQSTAYADKAAQAVNGDIVAAAKKWASLPGNERDQRLLQATSWATRHAGHRVDCPACKSPAITIGEPTTPPIRSIEGDLVTETQTMLPHRFQCRACGLKIIGLARLTVVGLGKLYKKTETFDGYELFSPDEPDASWDYDDDNNEPV